MVDRGMMEKLRVGLFFGGRSVEHEVSIASASSILKALDPARYEVFLIGVSPNGRWHLGSPDRPPEASFEGAEVNLPAVPGPHTLVPAGPGSVEASATLDVVFPIIHGQGGEDGTLQGLLELADLPYVGAGVLGSAIQMDKEVSTRLLSTAGIPVVPWTTVRKSELAHDAAEVARRVLGDFQPPLFVKPANLGSSVGISRVTQEGELADALAEAARYDTKILIEPAIDAREIEIATLGNDSVEASIPGEIRPRNGWYDYEAKYVAEDTELLVPAPISQEQTEAMQRVAREAVQVLEGAGLARVDFLLDRSSGEFYVNEINSLPGFTEISMFPRLWVASGLSYPALLDRLIELALERHRTRSRLETRYQRT